MCYLLFWISLLLYSSHRNLSKILKCTKSLWFKFLNCLLNLILLFHLQPPKKVDNKVHFSYFFVAEVFYMLHAGGETLILELLTQNIQADTINLLNMTQFIDIFIIHILFFSQKKQPNLTRTAENIQINEEDNEIRYFIC